MASATAQHLVMTHDETHAPDTEAIRGEIRIAGFQRVSHGLFLPPRSGLSDAAAFRRELSAWRLVLPPHAVFTHVTGARLMGWQLPNLPEHPPVFAAVEGDQPRPRRPGLICSRLTRETGPVGDALPVDLTEEIFLRAARDLGTLDVTIMLDSARRLGHVDPHRMDRILASGRPGTRVLGTAWELSSPLAESGGETVLRVFDECIDVPVEPQVTLLDDQGRVVGRADLLVKGTRLIHEYDGAHHRSSRQHTADLRRDRGLAVARYERRGFTLDDLINHPSVLMHEVDRDLGRPHQPMRLDRWRRLVENSLYSEIGRQRVMNRWQRTMGVIEWSRTA